MTEGVKAIFPKGEALRLAVRWISEAHSYDMATIEEASRRYDLSPNEEEFLIRHFLHSDRGSEC